MTRIKPLILASLGLFLLAACSGGSGPARTADQLVRTLADDVVIIEFKGGRVTAGDVNEQVSAEAQHYASELLDSYKKAAEQVLVMKLLETEAKNRGLSGPQELMAQVAQEISISDEVIDAFIDENNLREGIRDPRSGQVRQVTREEVEGFLMEQEMQGRQQAFFNELRADANVRVRLEKPRAQVIATGREPFKGGKNAKVVIHEFSSFQCPFCARGKQVMNQVVTEYGDRVKVVYRHLPLGHQAESQPAAVASMCAHNQGKFWEFHELAFDNQPELGTESYMKWAEKIGVDMEKFTNCFENQETLAHVQADLQAAQTMGVNSTPTFFVNGNKVSGAQPFSQFKSLIDEELASGR